MPEVPGSPYEPYPTVEPQIEMLRPGGLPDVPAAFGAATARAISAFGGDVEQAKEVFERGLALRRMQLEGTSRDIATDTMNNVERIKNEFRNKEGYAAGPDAMNGAFAAAEQERLSGRAKAIQAGGDYGGKLFDDQYAPMQRSITRDIGSWSQQQFRHAQDQGQDAATASALDRLRNSTNVEDFDTFVNGIPKIAADKAAFKGEGQDWRDRYAGILTSQAVLARADALARVGRYQEARAFIDAHEKQILGEEDRSKAQVAVNNSEDRFLGRDTARAGAQGFAPYMTPREIDRTQGVSTPLLETFKRAQQNHPEIEMTIGDRGGRRTLEEQAQLVAQGRSQTMQSGHLDGTAVDVVGRVNGQPAYQDLTLQKKVDGAMREAAKELGVDLRPQISWDQYHFQLDKDYNQAGFVRPPLPSLQQQKEANVAYVRKASPNNPGLPDSVVAHTDEQWRIKQLSDRSQFLDAKEQFENMLAAGQIRTPSDVPPDLIRQAQQSGAVGATWAAGIPRAIRVHLDNDNDYTPLRQANFDRLRGMLSDDGKRMAAAHLDPYAVDMRADERKVIQGMQRLALQGRPPPIAHQLDGVMRTLDPLLLENGIDRQMPDEKTQNKYWELRGRVYDRLQQMLDNEEPVPTNPTKLQEIFAPMIKDVSLVKDLRVSTPAPSPVAFTGRTADAPGKPTLRERTDGTWVP